MFNIDVDLEKLTEWSKIYLTHLVYTSDTIEVYRTRNGFHIRNIPDIYEYLRPHVDDPRRIQFEEVRGSLSRKYVLFNAKTTFIIRRGKIFVVENSEEEEVDRDEFVREIS